MFSDNMKTIHELEPPDGGYGWVIVVASALNFFIAAPLSQLFGMIYQGALTDIGLSAAQESFIIDLNSGFAMLTGLLNGPLLNRFGYRKISYLGAFLMCFGVFCLHFATNMAQYVILYGLVTSFGVGISNSSYSLAVNTYFKEKRHKAVALTLTIAGLGPIVMPQLMNFFMNEYSIKGVSLILSGICAHCFVAATLLQPVKYHLKKTEKKPKQQLERIVEEDEENEEDSDHQGEVDDAVFTLPMSSPRFPFNRSLSFSVRRKDSLVDVYYDQLTAGVYGLDSLIGTSMVSIPVNPVSAAQQNTKTKYQWWRSASTINLGSSVNIFDEETQANKVYNELSVKKEEEPLMKRFIHAIVNIFDLTLLKDPVYCNILLGLSLAVFSEVDFSVSTAFILTDFGMDTTDIAEFLSIQAGADIVFRFLSPYIEEFFNQPPRIMYMFSLVFIIATRFLLLFVTDIRYIFLVAAGMGCAKGLRTVYMYLIIPSYVKLDRLATASGMQMILNGIFLLVGGPLIGFVRDATGSYKNCIIIFNCLTMCTIVTWSVEFLIKALRKRKMVEENHVVEMDDEQNSTLLTSL